MNAKEIIYSDLSKNTEEQLGNLKEAFDNFPKNKYLYTFLLTEMRTRINKILWEEDISSEEKVGAVKQLLNLTDLIVAGNQVIYGLLKKKVTPQKRPDNFNKEKFKDKVLT